jgi:hypothetical protein
MPPPTPPPPNRKPPGFNPQPKPIGPPKMTAGQKASRDARNPKLPVNANQAIKAGETGKGHMNSRHVNITPGQMVDKTLGKNPGDKAFNPAKAQPVATKFASKTQGNKAVSAVMNTPAGKQALAHAAKQPIGTVSGRLTATIPKPINAQAMSRPAPVNVNGKKVIPAGPPHFTSQKTKTIGFRVENTPKGPGIHTAFPVIAKPGAPKKK